MIANIALDDGLILPHSANPTGSNFRERQWTNARSIKAAERRDDLSAEPSQGLPRP
jgi:hypothetical protein